MVLEIAEIHVVDGAGAGFVEAYRRAVRHLLASPGCRSARLTRGVETPTRFVLLVEWDTLEDHTDGFRTSPAFAAWRAELGPFFAAPPQVEHAVDVVAPGAGGSGAGSAGS